MNTKAAEKRKEIFKRGYGNFVITRGILQAGVIYALGMMITRFYLSDHETLNFADFFLTPRTWFWFVFNAVLFGAAMGTFFWFLLKITSKNFRDDASAPDHE